MIFLGHVAARPEHFDEVLGPPTSSRQLEKPALKPARLPPAVLSAV